MNDLIRQLLDLNTLTWGQEGASFGFERPIPEWGWLLVALAATALAVWSYSRLVGRTSMKVALAALRAALLILLVVLIAGPRLVQTQESVERDWLLVLVDRSASMTIADASSGDEPRITRERQLRDTIEDTWPMWRQLSEDRTIVWLGFDQGAYDLDARVSSEESDTPRIESIDLGQPDGQRTAMGSAIDQALARAAARPLSAIVVLSDGRSIDEPSRAALRRLQAERVPVHVVPLGSRFPVGDLAIAAVDAPSSAFVGDVTPIRVDLETPGAAAGAVVRLTDAATGMVLDERRIEPSDETEQSVTLLHKPDEAGSSNWVVEVIPDTPDLIPGNNSSELSINLVDRPLRVLYADGYPRWEQRYLRNMLRREKSILSSAIMLATDRRYTQEGDIEIDTLPDSPEQWAEYDVVILGDARPDVFTWEQLTHLRDHIAERGAGLIWIAGAAQTPNAWWDTPLGDLLPFSREGFTAERIPEPFVMAPTPAAERYGVLMLGEDSSEPWPPILTDPDAGWSTLYWGQLAPISSLKPTSEVLATARTLFTPEETPLVVSMRYGAGRSIYVATDETWRYRFARGEVLFERFWLQMIRMLGRESLVRSGKSAVIQLGSRRATIDQPVLVKVELLDQALLDRKLPSISVRLTRRPDLTEDTSRPQEIEITLRPDRSNPRVYSATWLPPTAGSWIAEPIDPELAGFELSSAIEVELPDSELRLPEADHESLERLASLTSGEVVPVAQVGSLPEKLPNRQVRIINERSESLWDTPLALILLITLLTAEWVGRRVIRLI